jgi:peptidyl-tRNA hydrolase, PTH1 family
MISEKNGLDVINRNYTQFIFLVVKEKYNDLMKLMVGLGNYGDNYGQTRHNAGFMILDQMVCGVPFREDVKFMADIVKSDLVWYVKPKTYMNNSGLSVQKIVSYFDIEMTDLMVVHDDLDIRLGDYKIQLGIGPKVHNGILSIERQLKNKNFWRTRVGVDNRSVYDRTMTGADYVLQKMSGLERDELTRVAEKTKIDLERWLSQ